MMSSAVWGAPGATPVVLLHGYPTNALLWRRIGPTLSAEGFRAFAPEFLGYGKSGDPTSGKYGIVEQARYLHQFISGIGLRDVVVVGHGLGGGVAQHLAIAHSELILGLVLVNTISERNWPALPLQLLRLKPAEWVGRLADLTLGFERILERVIRPGMVHPARLTQPVLDAFASSLAERGGSAHLARMARDLTVKDTEGLAPKLAALSIPKLVVWGADDPYLSLESGQKLADAADAELAEIPDCGHFVPEECPFELAEVMLPFLARRIAERAERLTGRTRRTGELIKPDRFTE